MNTELDLFLLEQAKGYLKSLSDEQFLSRCFRAPNSVTAGVFDRRRDTIKKFLHKKK